MLTGELMGVRGSKAWHQATSGVLFALACGVEKAEDNFEGELSPSPGVVQDSGVPTSANASEGGTLSMAGGSSSVTESGPTSGDAKSTLGAWDAGVLTDASVGLDTGESSAGEPFSDGSTTSPGANGTDTGALHPDSGNTTGDSEAETGTEQSRGEDDAGSGEATAPTPEIPAAALDELHVSGLQYPLKPSFSPDRERYSVVAQAGGDAPVVVATALAGVRILLDGVEVDSGEATPLDGIAPGEAFEVVVSNDSGASRAYEVQVLPSDFPDLRVTVDAPGASMDPVYVALRRGMRRSYVVKFDNAGVPLFYRAEDVELYDFKKHPGGQMSYALGRSGAVHVVLDSEYGEVATYETVGLVNTDVHEFHILPNGNRIMMAYEPADRDATPYGGLSNQRVADSVLQEVSSSGDVVFEWNSWGLLALDESVYPSSVDYAHVNSVEVMDDGHWLVSSRGLAQVFKVNRDDGSIIWRFGGISNQFTFIDDPYSHLCGQHTASQLDNGNILVFDNGLYCWPESPERGEERTRVVEYELDEQAMTARLVWSYERPGTFAQSQGSSQRLPNGNTLIGWGSNPDVLVTEVNPKGEIVFEVEAHHASDITNYRAWRFPE